MRGKKGVPHPDPEHPPRRRGNKVGGHGPWAPARPPVCGVVGRESGQVRLTVAEHSDRTTLEAVVGDATGPGATVNTDEWGGYNGLTTMGRGHATVCHKAGGWGGGGDGGGGGGGDGNTLEGVGGGGGEFLRPVRG